MSHVLDAFENAIVNTEPYTHTYIQNVFPWDYYREILKHLPPEELYTDGTYENRKMVDVTKLNSPFWNDLVRWMCSEKFCLLVCKKLGVNGEVYPQIRLVRDTSEYYIKPHTDVPRKVVSLLFYLPTDMSMLAYGTSVLVPKAPIEGADGYKRHEFELFDKVWTAPFAPNSVLGFKRCNHSWHGVEKQGLGTRNVLLYNVYA
jgi:hypothetical protein